MKPDYPLRAIHEARGGRFFQRPSIDELMTQVGYGAVDIRGLKAGEMVTTEFEGGSAAFFKNRALTE